MRFRVPKNPFGGLLSTSDPEGLSHCPANPRISAENCRCKTATILVYRNFLQFASVFCVFYKLLSIARLKALFQGFSLWLSPFSPEFSPLFFDGSRYFQTVFRFLIPQNPHFPQSFPLSLWILTYRKSMRKIISFQRQDILPDFRKNQAEYTFQLLLLFCQIP